MVGILLSGPTTGPLSAWPLGEQHHIAEYMRDHLAAHGYVHEAPRNTSAAKLSDEWDTMVRRHRLSFGQHWNDSLARL